LIDTNLDHVGMVVPKLEPAIEQLSSSLGLRWLPTVDRTLSMHEPGRGTRDTHLRIAHSVEYPRLEVIEAVPDSPWSLEGSSWLLHHIAFLAGDLARDSSRVAGPCPIEICGVDVEGEMPKMFTYHIQNGFRFELLERRPARPSSLIRPTSARGAPNARPGPPSA
jgi:hypothetical protein